jgi:hypothetical protein
LTIFSGSKKPHKKPLQGLLNFIKICAILSMAQRKVPPHKRSKAAGISLPPEIIREARKHAYAQGMSLSGFVRMLLLQRLSGPAA